jgi:hypothetical protein
VTRHHLFHLESRSNIHRGHTSLPLTSVTTSVFVSSLQQLLLLRPGFSSLLSVVYTSHLSSVLLHLPVPFTLCPTIIYIFLQHLLPTFHLSQSSIPLTSHLSPIFSHVPTLTSSPTIVYNFLQHLFSTFQPSNLPTFQPSLTSHPYTSRPPSTII